MKKRGGFLDGFTFLDGFNLGAAPASGVDGLLVLLGSGVGVFLADDDGLPVLRDGSDSGHQGVFFFSGG